MLTSRLNDRLCPLCGSTFQQQRLMQAVCGPVCARRKVNQDKAAKKADERARRDALKTIQKLIAEAQSAFNEWIRARDEGLPCICCGRFPQSGAGHVWDAGHYRSTGSASHLRFNPDNVHRQLVICNRHGAGRAVDYRLGLIARIGLARVEALESDNTPRKWTREELESIKTTYRARTRALKRDRE